MDDRAVVESHVLWNNAVGRRHLTFDKVERDFPYSRTTYSPGSRRNGFSTRVLKKLGLR